MRRPDALYDGLAPGLGYLMKLERRLIEAGDTDLLALVRDARDAMHRLCVGIHYMACGSRVGRADVPAKSNCPDSAETRTESNPKWITSRSEQRTRASHSAGC